MARIRRGSATHIARSRVGAPVAHARNERDILGLANVVLARRAEEAQRIVGRALRTRSETKREQRYGMNPTQRDDMVRNPTCDMYSMFSDARRSSPKWMA